MSTIAADREQLQPPARRTNPGRLFDRLVDALCLLGMGLSLLLLAASVAALVAFACLSYPLAASSASDALVMADVAVLAESGMAPPPCLEQDSLDGLSPAGVGSADGCQTPGPTVAVGLQPEATPTLVVAQGLPEVVVAGLEWGQPNSVAFAEAWPKALGPGVPTRPRLYRVVEGDSLSGVAATFGITPETVLWANDIMNPELLLAGQELKILPVSGVLHQVAPGDSVSAIADMYGADPKRIREANALPDGAEPLEGQALVVPGGMMRTTEPIEAPPTPPPAAEIQAAAKYNVKAGDSLGSIADGFGVMPSAIQAANDLMNPDLLAIGQILAIPGAGNGASRSSATGEQPKPAVAAAAADAPRTAPTAIAPTATPPPTPPAATPAASGAQYTAKTGDNLYSIARSFGVKPQAIQDANGLSDPTKLTIGLTLSIPGVAAGTQPQPASQPPAATAVPSPVATVAPVPSALTPVPPAPTPTPTAPKPAPTAPKPAPVQPAPLPTTVQPAQLPAPAQAAPAGGALGDRIASIAQKYLGYRYIWEGASPSGFDCSGFTWYVYREAGWNIPIHDLGGQLNSGQKIARDRLAPGDLVFFENTYMKGLSHVGIYLGGGRFINAETEKVGVQIRSLSDPYWSTRYVGASRPWQ